MFSWDERIVGSLPPELEQAAVASVQFWDCVTKEKQTPCPFDFLIRDVLQTVRGIFITWLLGCWFRFENFREIKIKMFHF